MSARFDPLANAPSSGLPGHVSPERSALLHRASAAIYRVGQVWNALMPRPLDADDLGLLHELLPPAGQTLFASMSVSDQRHSLTVCRRLRKTGCDDADLLAAALLHDCGKGDGRVRLWVRPPFVLLNAFAPGVLRWLARAPVQWWRRPFYNAWHHADIGADRAAAAGLAPNVVLLIRTHHLPDGPAAALHAVDDAS